MGRVKRKALGGKAWSKYGCTGKRPSPKMERTCAPNARPVVEEFFFMISKETAAWAGLVGEARGVA